jgi:molybdenum ABC transporter molybdate-binding protein
MRIKTGRPGSIHFAWIAFLVSIGLLGALMAALYLVADSGTTANATGPLVVYCAAGIKEPIEAAAKQYEKTYGMPVHLQYGGSQTLLANMEVSHLGDLYVPADDYYIQLAREKKLVAEAIPLATMTPVIAVPKGNPKKIASLDDLLTGNLRISQANPDAAAVGKLTRDALQANGQWDALKKRTLVFKLTVNDVANDVKVGATDAGIVWDATVRQMTGLEAIAVPELAGKKAHMAAGVLTSSTQPTAALRFARYLAAPDKGQVELEKAGFTPVQGDVWEESPEMRLYAGGMLKPAIDETINAFEKREGVKVVRVYNGCGILVGQMKTGAVPDAYFACDKSFMKMVDVHFPNPVDVSSNQLVIIVHKGNPKQVRELKDLAKPGLRVGVGHEQQCAMGAITQETLKVGGLVDPVMKNVVTQTPSADLLMNQLRSGGLDAIVAYISMAADADDVEAYSIEGIPCAIAVQPMAVGKDSKHRQLAARLMEAIRSAESKKEFTKYGFGWKDQK